MAYQIPQTPWPDNWNIGPQMNNFVQEFMQGYQVALSRKRQSEQDELERKKQKVDEELRREGLKLQKDRFSQEERANKIQEKITAREQIQKAIEAMKTQDKPTEVMPESEAQLGAPETARVAPAAVTPQVLPAVPEIGVPEQGITPQYREDVLRADKAAKEQANAEALDLYRRKMQAEEPYNVAASERESALAAQRDAAAEARARLRGNKASSDAQKLRNEYNTQLKPYLPQVDAYNKAMAIAAVPGEQRTAQDDISLVFLYMKSLDPTSTVREGEYATARNAAGVPDRVRNMWNQLVDGKFLTPAQRAGMGGSIERDWNVGPGRRINILQNRYRYLGRQAGVEDPDQMILMDIGTEPAPTAGPEAPGSSAAAPIILE